MGSEWRGRGVSRALVEAARQAAVDLNHRSIVLRTEAFRTPAIALYRSLGFHEVPCDDGADGSGL